MDIFNEISVVFKIHSSLDNVYLVGNCEALGNWKPESGINLEKIDSYYITLNPIRLLKESKLEYKYLTMSSTGPQWETIENRKLVPHGNLFIEETFNHPVSNLDYCPKRFERLRRKSSEIRLGRLHSCDYDIIIISIELPFRVIREGGVWEVRENNSSWHSQLYDVCGKKVDFIWIGCPGLDVPLESQAEVTEILAKYKCMPVFVPEETLRYHKIYCEKILFDILHNVIDIQNPLLKDYTTRYWEGYKVLNILFNEVLLNNFNGQMIWIHGCELFLLPSFISKKIKDPVNIGLYLHTPFPSSEVFNVLPHMNTILNAVCCCDIIGFQVFEYASQFIDTCKLVLGVESNTSKDGCIYLNYFGRDISIYIGHIGILPEKIQKTQTDSDYIAVYNNIYNQFIDKNIVLSIDNATQLSGVSLKFKAIKSLFNKPQKLPDNLIFLQILIPNSEFSPDNLIALGQEINKELSCERIKIIIKEISLYERYAYMQISSVLFIGTIREGWSLLPFEYLSLKKYQNSGIIISEFVGTCRALSSPYKVNPFDINDVGSSILNLLNHSPSKSKIKKDLSYIEAKSTLIWVLDFIAQMKISIKSTHKYQYVPIGMGDTLRVMAIPKEFNKLDDYQVLSAYRSSSNRLLFFDIEGALLGFVKEPESFTPSHKVISALEVLCSDSKNTVVIITGRERSALNRWFGSILNLNIAAENGAYLKLNSDDWENLANSSIGWKEYSRKIIESYVQRIEGSYIIVKESSVVFNYLEADAMFGKWHAKDLISNLEASLSSEDCEIMEGDGFVEVKPRGIDKGNTLFTVLDRTYQRKGTIDFIFAIGEDASDEKMFKVLKLLKKRKCSWLDPDLEIFTCTFGIKPSVALYYFLNPDEVLKLIELLSTSTNKKAYSLGNLTPRNSHHHFTTINVNSLIRDKKKLGSGDFKEILSPYNLIP